MAKEEQNRGASKLGNEKQGTQEQVNLESDNEAKVSRNHKDGLFRMLFSDKRELLNLYNALSGRNYQDPEVIEITTLINAIYIGVKNDISFVIDGYLSFYEHQSTICGNMPLRILLYISSVYSRLISKVELYSEHPITLPNPRFIVFYNGTKKQEDREIRKLSDAYEHKEEEVSLELKVLVLNINEGHNKELMEQCTTLHGYSYYVARVREYSKTMALAKAVDMAVQHCIKHHILEDFLRQERGKVKELNLYEYDFDAHMEQLEKDAERRGIEQGRVSELISLIRKKNENGLDVLQISNHLDLEESYVEQVIGVIKENLEASDLEIVELLQNVLIM